MRDEQRPPEPKDDDEKSRAAYLPIGIVFLVLGLGGFVNEALRPAAFAFVPIGVTFLILSMRGSDADEEPPDAPDVTPR